MKQVQLMKEIKHFPQHPLDPKNPTMETCGAACVMMLLDYYDRISYPTPKMEHKLYNRYRVNGYKGMTGAGVARCLAFEKNELEVHLVQSFQCRMDTGNNDPVYEKIADSHEMHLAACKDRIRFTAGLEFDTEFLIQQLNDGKKIILELFIPEVEDGPPSVLHWVIVESYDARRNTFRIRDPKPRTGPRDLSAAELEACMKTPIGRICIAVSDGRK